jgi:bicarbonate transport system permease protein
MTTGIRKSSGFRIGNMEISAKTIKKNVLPPAIAIFTFLALWEALSASGITLLPGPSSLITDPRTFELVKYPFYDRGGIDKGMFWQTWD